MGPAASAPTRTTADLAGLPPGYPTDMVRDVRLADGRQVRLRPVLPSDVDELRRAVAAADPETLRRRFLGGRPPRGDRELARLLQVDYSSRCAVAAFDGGGRGVGIARYEGRPGCTSAEVAVAVDPGWRRIGLATALLRLLAERAREAGVRVLTAEYLADNPGVQQLLADAGPGVRRAAPQAGVGAASVVVPGPAR